MTASSDSAAAKLRLLGPYMYGPGLVDNLPVCAYTTQEEIFKQTTDKVFIMLKDMVIYTF